MAESRTFVRGKLSASLLLIGFFIARVCVYAAEVSTLVVNKNPAYLRAQQQPQAEVVAELSKGDILTPLANALGNHSWYLVQTQKGLTGWIQSSDVDGTASLEKIFHEPENVATSLVAPNEGSSSTDAPSNRREISVPIRTDGTAIIVPVELNRTVTTYMVMDTGATITVITPGLAKRLGLKFGSRIATMLANGAVVTAPTARVNSVRIGSAEVNGVMVSVQNFSPHPHIEGLLGLNFFSRFRTSIDSRSQRLILAPR